MGRNLSFEMEKRRNMNEVKKPGGNCNFKTKKEKKGETEIMCVSVCVGMGR